MWLYLPERLSACSRESAPLISPSAEYFQMLAASSTWRGKSRLWRLWQRAWSRENWMPRLFGPTFGRSQQESSEAVSIWWREAFPVRTCHRPEDGPASTDHDLASSSDSWTSFAMFTPATSSWRTSQQSLFEDSTPFSGRWPKAGSMHAGAASERPPLARHINEIAGGASRGPAGLTRSTPLATDASGSKEHQHRKDGTNLTILGQARQWASAWPTPTVSSGAQDGQNPTPGQTGGTTLEGAARLWQTPRVSFAPRRSGARSSEPLLTDQARQWATPNASVANDGETPETWHAPADALKQKGINGNGAGIPLTIQAQDFGRAFLPDRTTTKAGAATSPTIRTSPLQLNELFVEVLMGLRSGWTDFAASETPSCPSKPRPPCASSGTARSGGGLDA